MIPEHIVLKFFKKEVFKDCNMLITYLFSSRPDNDRLSEFVNKRQDMKIELKKLQWQ